MEEYNVYLNSRLIETVFFIAGTLSDDVKKELVNHDNYDSRIVVRRKRK